MKRVGCVVLAAGASRRLGSPKQLLRFYGVPLVRRAAEEACGSRCFEVAVIVGACADRVRHVLGGVHITILENGAWEEGIASSIRAAVAHAKARHWDALVLAICDQPYLQSIHIDVLVAEWHRGHELVASEYSGVLGVPALFAASWFDRLAELQGDHGAGGLLRSAEAAYTVPWPDGAVDVDTAADVMRLGL